MSLQNTSIRAVSSPSAVEVPKKMHSSAVSWCNGYKDNTSTTIHCPLCVYDIVYPKQDDRQPAIIFLDMDGVLMQLDYSTKRIEAIFKELFPHVEDRSYTHFQRNLVLSRCLDRHALYNLHNIIEKVEESGQRPLVVISAAWRQAVLLDQQRTDIYAQHKFSRYLCGKTPIEGEFEEYGFLECKLGFEFYESAQKHYNIVLEDRSSAIEFWLRDHGFEPATANFVVIDNGHLRSLSKFGKRFIKTDYILKSTHARAAIEVLCEHQNGAETLRPSSISE